MSLVSDRPGTKARIVEVWQDSAELASVHVTYGDPGDNWAGKTSSLWVGDADGNQETVAFGKGTAGRNDVYVIRAQLMVRDAATQQEADQAAWALFDTAASLVVDGVRLGNDFASTITSIGAVNGPKASEAAGNRPDSVVTFDIEIKAPIRG